MCVLKIELDLYNINIYELNIMSTKKPAYVPRNNANKKPILEISDDEFAKLHEVYEIKKELNYGTTPGLLIDPDTKKEYKSAGGVMKYFDFVVINPIDYFKNKKISYTRFKLESSAGRGFCVLNSNAKFPGGNGDGKDKKDEKKVDTSGNGTLSFSYNYPADIENYVGLTAEQIEKKLQDKFAIENKDGDVVARGKYVVEQQELIGFCMKAYLRDKFLTNAFEHSYRSEFNNFTQKLSYAKLFDDQATWEALKDALTIKTHNQIYSKISVENTEDMKAFSEEKKKYEALVKSNGDTKTCNYGLGKKYVEENKVRYKKIDNPIYWIKRKMAYVATPDGDYKITNGRDSAYGKWDQFKLTYENENGDQLKDHIPNVFSDIRYAMTMGSLSKMTFSYQCVWNVDKNTLTMTPKVPSVIVVNRAEPKTRANENKADDESLELMKKFSKNKGKKPAVVNENKEEAKDEKKEVPKPKEKTVEQKAAEQKALVGSLLSDPSEDDD